MTLQTILIVDDDPFIQAYMAKVINELGYEVITANNGKSGLETAGALLPDLILLDWNMPEMDGIETLSRLKQNHKTKGSTQSAAFYNKLNVAISHSRKA